jgi:putative permease
LQQLPDNYPDIISIEQVAEMVSAVRMEITSLGQRALSISISSVVGALTILVYLVIVPILIFFFLKDKKIIVAWIRRFVPSESQFAEQVWVDVDRQIGNYVRGKFWEIIIVWLVCVVVFSVLGLDYAMLLAVCVGLSVLIPYVGAAVVTVPVVLVAWFQWGWSGDLMWVVIAYLIIQMLDGNVLVPLLFSEVTNLHPIAIIAAVLIFGGIWGVLGVFFSIPLATVVQAILSSWPVVDKSLKNTSA